jgi:DNA-binding transcriptional ArsR family regulator
MADDQLSLTFAALADPIRRSILARLTKGEATVNELAEPFDVSLQAVSKHLKVLERAGLISRGRDAQFRPCRLETEPLDGAVDWISEHRRTWADRFDRLDQHLRTLTAPTDRPAQPEQPAQSDRPIQPEQPAQSDRPIQPEQPGAPT